MIVTGVDFVSVPTQDLERAVAFYGETLGLERTVHRPEHGFAEFDTGTVTFNVHDPKQMGIGEFSVNKNHLALQVEDVPAGARRRSRSAASSSWATWSTPASATWRSSATRTATR